MKKLSIRALASIIAMLMLLAALPITASAAELSADGATLSLFDGEITITSSSMSTAAFTYDADSDASFGYTQNLTARNGTANSTITITNHSTAATLSFTATATYNYYGTSNGNVCEGTARTGTRLTSGEGKIYNLKPGETQSYYLASLANRTKGYEPVSINFTNVLLVSPYNDVVVCGAEGGTIKTNADSDELRGTDAVKTVANVFIEDGIQLSATPDDGYVFLGWLSGSDSESMTTLLSTLNTYILYPGEKTYVTAVFYRGNVGHYAVGDALFDDFNAAMAASVEKATPAHLLNTAVLPAGDYVIPEGAALNIPNDVQNTYYTDVPNFINAGVSPANQHLFRSLTLENGANITVNGSLSLAATAAPGSGSKSCGVSDEYTQMILSDNTSIEVNDGGYLYAWGFITGSGKVLAHAGATVYEIFQIADFRGGTATLSIYQASSMEGGDLEVFPFSQYYVQNIEAPITLESGASEYVTAGLFASGTLVPASVAFIGENALFALEDGSTLTKYYNVDEDRLYCVIDGNASLNPIGLSIMGFEINSSAFVLPISNIVVEVASGELFTDQKIVFLPDSGVIIDEGATLNNDGVLYIVDVDDWGPYVHSTGGNVYLAPLAFSPSLGGPSNRSLSTMKSAFVDINGTFESTYIFETSIKGADVISSNGTGSLYFAYIDNEPGLLQAVTQNTDGTVNPVDIETTSAMLKNADGTFTFTAGREDDDVTFIYVNGKWINAATKYTVTYKNASGAVLFTQEYGVTEAEPVYTEIPSFDGTAEPGYTYAFKEWVKDVDESGNVTYTAAYDAILSTATVTFKNEDGTVLQETEYSFGETPIYNGAAPEKSSDNNWIYSFAGWEDGTNSYDRNEELPAVSGDVTYTARFASVARHYDITFKDWDGTVITTIPCEYTVSASMLESIAPTPFREADTQYTYTFAGWDPALRPVSETLETTYTATYTTAPVAYTVTFDVEGVKTAKSYAYGETPVFDSTPTKASDSPYYTYEFSGWTPEITAVSADAEYTAMFNKIGVTGWVTDETGKTYAIDGEKAYFDKTVEIENEVFYFNAEGYLAEALREFDGEIYVFDDNGVIDTDYNGFYDSNADTYYVENGKVEKSKNLIENNKLFYFVDDEGKLLKNESRWIDDTNGLLPVWEYEFDENGAIIHDADITKNGIATADSNGALCYFINGVKVHKGLFKNADGSYSYAKGSGELVVDRTYWITDVNGLLDEGSYLFDADGKIVLTDGVYNVEGTPYYFENGVKTYKGLFELDGSYYYAKTDGALVTNKTYWVTKTNGLLPEQSYTFDETGKIVDAKPGLNGIVEEDGALWYYENGVKTYKGLFELEGSFYYAKSNGEIVASKRYWISKTNDLLPEQSYTFDENGKIADAQPGLNGIVEENGALWYYENGVKTYKGLFELDGSYYYAKSDGQIVAGKSYWISKTNGLLAEQSYTFDENGKMADAEPGKEGIVAEDGKLFYFENGVKTYKGVFEVDGSYYYAKTSGEIVTGRSYWISKTNDILVEKSYTFDENGVILDPVLK